jgi:hypothetical protein
VTWLVASVAVETGIPPSELLADEYMLGAIVAYLQWRTKEQRKAAGRRRG